MCQGVIQRASARFLFVKRVLLYKASTAAIYNIIRRICDSNSIPSTYYTTQEDKSKNIHNLYYYAYIAYNNEEANKELINAVHNKSTVILCINCKWWLSILYNHNGNAIHTYRFRCFE